METDTLIKFNATVPSWIIGLAIIAATVVIVATMTTGKSMKLERTPDKDSDYRRMMEAVTMIAPKIF